MFNKSLYKSKGMANFPLFNLSFWLDCSFALLIWAAPYSKGKFGNGISTIEDLEFFSAESGFYWNIACLIFMGGIIIYRMILRLRPLIKVSDGVLSIYNEGLYPGESDIADIKHILVCGTKDKKGAMFSIVRKDNALIRIADCENFRTPEDIITFLHKHDISTKFVQK